MGERDRLVDELAKQWQKAGIYGNQAWQWKRRATALGHPDEHLESERPYPDAEALAYARSFLDPTEHALPPESPPTPVVGSARRIAELERALGLCLDELERARPTEAERCYSCDDYVDCRPGCRRLLATDAARKALAL